MNINIFCDNKVKIDKSSFEVVETKGKGHPDNICDTLAELVSAKYSTYCLDNFGFIPRHMIDKISIIGGSCVVNFGGGFMKKPIKVLLNGRFTEEINGIKINAVQMAEDTIKDYIQSLLPMLDADNYVKIIDNTHKSQGPGVVYNSSNKTKNNRSSWSGSLGGGSVNYANYPKFDRCMAGKGS